jgi:hypothetical protein
MNRALVIQELHDPNLAKQALLNFFQANGVDTHNLLSKSLANINYYWQLPMSAVAAGTTTMFFGKSPAVATANNTNLPNQKTQLPQDEHVVITSIRILDGNNATLQATAWNYGANLAWVKNALMSMTRNNVKQFTDLPLSGATAGLTTDDLGFIHFDNPILWEAQTYVEVDIKNFSATTANDNLRIELHGYGLTS